MLRRRWLTSPKNLLSIDYWPAFMTTSHGLLMTVRRVTKASPSSVRPSMTQVAAPCGKHDDRYLGVPAQSADQAEAVLAR